MWPDCAAGHVRLCPSPPAEPVAAMSDSDKIGLQLQLDARELGSQLRGLLAGGPAADEAGLAAALPAFGRLLEAVGPALGTAGGA
jgi:hypothetical protein